MKEDRISPDPKQNIASSAQFSSGVANKDKSQNIGNSEPKTHGVSERSDDTTKRKYIIVPKNPTDDDTNRKTEEFLKSITKQTSIFSAKSSTYGLIWWLANATNVEADTIKKNSGIAEVDEDTLDKAEAAVVVPSAPSKLSAPNNVRRDLQYSTQTSAVSELVFISQPTTVPRLSDLTNYVYEAKGGAGIYIYHVGEGVNTQRTIEFPSTRLEVVQTEESLQMGQAPGEDTSVNSHSTGTASKATGERYGSAKKATLVVFKMASLEQSEAVDVFRQVWDHINAHHRRGKSIITYSLSSGDPVDPNRLSFARRMQKIHIKTLLDHDVPVFVAAGNRVQDRPNVDTAPGVLEGPDYPLVVVGACDMSGLRAFFSRVGSQVSLYAPGDLITAQNKDNDDGRTDSGTSFATPLLAGMLATYLAYDTVPFDTTPGKLAAAAKAFLIQTANWQRVPNLKSLWNEVDEAHNPKKGSTTDKPSTSGPAPRTAPYAQGKCSVSVTQWKKPLNDDGTYSLEVSMTVNNKNQIGYTQRGDGYSDSKPLQFLSKLEDILTCRPEKKNDYIAFTLGSQTWPSNGKFAKGDAPSSCTVGAWTGWVGHAAKNTEQKRDINCVFDCTWGGGKSSDDHTETGIFHGGMP